MKLNQLVGWCKYVMCVCVFFFLFFTMVWGSQKLRILRGSWFIDIRLNEQWTCVIIGCFSMDNGFNRVLLQTETVPWTLGNKCSGLLNEKQKNETKNAETKTVALVTKIKIL